MQVSPVSLALQDRNPYVRRTAVLGVLKIFNLDAAAVRNAGVDDNTKQTTQRDQARQALLHFCLTADYVCVQAGMLEDLHDMLQKDPDAQVVANCMSVLLEVRAGPKLIACLHPGIDCHCM